MPNVNLIIFQKFKSTQLHIKCFYFVTIYVISVTNNELTLGRLWLL